jgi:hypothetical protein
MDPTKSINENAFDEESSLSTWEDDELTKFECGRHSQLRNSKKNQGKAV